MRADDSAKPADGVRLWFRGVIMDLSTDDLGRLSSCMPLAFIEAAMIVA